MCRIYRYLGPTTFPWQSNTVCLWQFTKSEPPLSLTQDVIYMWRVCVVDSWFTASPGLSQTDWTLAGWGCTPGVHEQSWHPRINQPSTHTLEEERLSWPAYHQLGEYQLPVKLQINISCTTSTRVLCRRSPRKATSVACGGATLPQYTKQWQRHNKGLLLVSSHLVLAVSDSQHVQRPTCLFFTIIWPALCNKLISHYLFYTCHPQLTLIMRSSFYDYMPLLVSHDSVILLH